MSSFVVIPTAGNWPHIVQAARGDKMGEDTVSVTVEAFMWGTGSGWAQYRPGLTMTVKEERVFENFNDALRAVLEKSIR